MEHIWTEENITAGIKAVMKSKGIDHMPSTVDIVEYAEKISLSKAISKTGGFKEWAYKLKLDIIKKECKKSREKTEKIVKLKKEGKKYKEISEIMNLSIPAIESRLNKDKEDRPVYISKRMEMEIRKSKEITEELALRKIEVAEICKKVAKQKEELKYYYEEQRQNEIKAIGERFPFMYKEG